MKWDDLRGNFTERQDLKLSPSVTETFANDSISRLDFSNRNGSQNLDVGYCANGNMEKRGGSSITYSSYNLPTVINQGSNSSTLAYGAFRNRYKQVAISSGTTETTLYVGGLFEKVTRPGGVIEYRHYIPGGQGTAAIHTRRSSGSSETYYWHADHLGSPELFTDSGGAALVRPSFGAFGERRDGTDWNGAPSAGDLTAIADITRRGFTGHEHLDSVGLIHMHGRVYDPAAGRFLGVDPILNPALSQDVNSYSYAWNSPLSVIDPTGLYEVTDRPDTRPIDPGPCFTCSGYQMSGDALREFLNRRWATPTLREAYIPPPFGPIAQSSNANRGAKWDGASFGADAVIFGVDSTVGGTGGIEKTLQDRAITIAAEISSRGYFKGKGEADWLYQINSDPSLTVTVDASLLTVEVDGNWWVDEEGRLIASGHVTGSDYAVHGQVTVRHRPDGSYGVFDAQYDFEIHWSLSPRAILRNIGAIFGSPPGGWPNTSFWIHYRGNVNVQ